MHLVPRSRPACLSSSAFAKGLSSNQSWIQNDVWLKKRCSSLNYVLLFTWDCFDFLTFLQDPLRRPAMSAVVEEPFVKVRNLVKFFTKSLDKMFSVSQRRIPGKSYWWHINKSLEVHQAFVPELPDASSLPSGGSSGYSCNTWQFVLRIC